MSDRIKGFVVTLDGDYKDEDAEMIQNAIRMIKGVENVDANIVDINDHMNRMRIKSEIKSKLYNTLKDE